MTDIKEKRTREKEQEQRILMNLRNKWYGFTKWQKKMRHN